MTNTNKMTKNEILDVIAACFTTMENEHKEDVLAYCAKEKESLARRAEKAKEYASKKRAENDALFDEIFNIMNENPMTINDIINSLPAENITPAKVTARMTKMINDNTVNRVMVKQDGRKLVGYVKA